MRNPEKERLKKLRALKPGQSFFVEDGTQSSVQSLRRLAANNGIAINIYTIECDSVHKKPGIRVFRSKM